MLMLAKKFTNYRRLVERITQREIPYFHCGPSIIETKT